jgi:hypothetical protein
MNVILTKEQSILAEIKLSWDQGAKYFSSNKSYPDQRAKYFSSNKSCPDQGAKYFS